MEDNLFEDNFSDEDDMRTEAFQKKVVKPSTLWNFFVDCCKKHYPNMKLPKKPQIKILSNLKKLNKDYGELSSKKYIEVCVKEWNIFKKKYKFVENYPNIILIFIKRESELSSVVEYGKIVNENTLFRGNDNRTDEFDKWLNKG